MIFPNMVSFANHIPDAKRSKTTSKTTGEATKENSWHPIQAQVERHGGYLVIQSQVAVDSECSTAKIIAVTKTGFKIPKINRSAAAVIPLQAIDADNIIVHLKSSAGIDPTIGRKPSKTGIHFYRIRLVEKMFV